MKTKIKTQIVVKNNYQLTHNWPGCDVEGVMFLQHEHMHYFNLKTIIEVFHDDRELEIIKVGREIDKFVKKLFPDNKMGSTSCEQLGLQVGVFLIERYPLVNGYRGVSVEVLEDNMNGAITTVEGYTSDEV